MKRHLAENIYDYLPWIFKYSTDRKIRIFASLLFNCTSSASNTNWKELPKMIMGHVKIKNNIPVSPDKWIFEYDINPINSLDAMHHLYYILRNDWCIWCTLAHAINCKMCCRTYKLEKLGPNVMPRRFTLSSNLVVFFSIVFFS